MNDVERLEIPLLFSDDELPGNDPPWRFHHWDRRGNPITFAEWGTLLQHVDKKGKSYKIVKQEYVGHYWVSTVWLGLDHGWGMGGAPVIFETMVFKEGDPDVENREDLDMERYCTEKEAIAGHKAMVEKVRLFVEAEDG